MASDGEERVVGPAGSPRSLSLTGLARTALTCLRRTSFGVGLLAIAVIGQSVWLVIRFGSRWTNEDQTLLWYAAREFASGRWHQPHFFGQRYGSVLESIPAAALYRLGVSLPTAQVLASAALGSLPWLVIACALWRRMPGWAAGILAIPLVLSTELRIIALAPRGFAVSLGLIAVAIVIVVRRSCITPEHGDAAQRVTARALACVTALVLIATVLDQTTAVVGVPLLVIVWFRTSATTSLLGRTAALAVGAVPAAGWELYGALFYRTRQDFDLFSRQTSFRPSWDSLVSNLRHVELLWAYLAPELLRDGRIPALVVTFVSLWAVYRSQAADRTVGRTVDNGSRWVVPIATAGMACALVGIMASPRAQRSFPLYLNTARLLLAVPIAVWLVAFEATRHRRASNPEGAAHRRWHYTADKATLARCLPLAVVAGLLLQLPAAGRRLDETVTRPIVVEPLRTSRVRATCAALARAAETRHDPLVVFWSDPALAYGCAALEGLPTMFGPLERRAWRTRAEMVVPRTSLLMWGWPPLCTRLLAGAACELVDAEHNLVALRFAAQPPIDVINAMGATVNSSRP